MTAGGAQEIVGNLHDFTEHEIYLRVNTNAIVMKFGNALSAIMFGMLCLIIDIE